jgi:hypothetical protein
MEKALGFILSAFSFLGDMRWIYILLFFKIMLLFNKMVAVQGLEPRTLRI